MTKQARPFVKWAGGKAKVVPQLVQFFPDEFQSYYEPFLGGGAVYFSISPQKGVLNDMNPTLVETYRHIRDSCEDIINDLQRLQLEYRLCENLDDKSAYYYERRDEFNTVAKKTIRKSSLLIFLNKTGFNGMYRENAKGLYNIPFGKHKNPLICDAENIRNVSSVLKEIEITCGSYEHAIGSAKKGDFVYLDPPYEPLTSTSSFTQYQAGGFTKEDQKKVQEIFEELSDRGCYVMVSNSTAPLIQELYSKNVINKINVARSINASVAKRGKIQEMVITNYVPNIGKYVENVSLKSNVIKDAETSLQNIKSFVSPEIESISNSNIILESVN